MASQSPNKSAKKLQFKQKILSTISGNKNQISKAIMESNQPVSVGKQTRPNSRLRRIEEKMRAADLEIDSDSDSSNDGWDTDLDDVASASEEEYEDPLKAMYINECKKKGMTPVSHYVRHFTDKGLHLSHLGLGSRDIKILAQSLVENTATVKLDLQDNRLEGEGAVAIANMMKENTTIKEINLAENRIRSEGANAVAEMLLYNTEMLSLNVSGNDFEDNDAEILSEPIMINFHLQTLNLSHNKFSIIGGQFLGSAIAQNDGIEDLDLSWNHLRKKGAHAIAIALRSNVRLKYLNLSWNGFADDGAAIMGETLKYNNTLLELDLSNNRIGVKGAKALALGLAVNDTIRVIKIGKNPIYAEGCCSILEAINRNPRTVIVDIEMQDILIDDVCGKILEEITKKFPTIKITHGGFSNNSGLKSIKVDPMAVLQEYIESHNLRIIDLFNRFDRDNSRTVDKREFLDGMKTLDVPLTKDQLLELVDRLDADGDGQIAYGELVSSSRGILLDKRTIKKKKLAADKEIEELAKQADTTSLSPVIRSNSTSRKSIVAAIAELQDKGLLAPNASITHGAHGASLSPRKSIAKLEGINKSKALASPQPRSISVVSNKSNYSK
ncbi:uncharacterized protein TRIADDRAFT_52814 [Trichoplax adhaerens]|uniref:EF-hand domain-containing protein n=1 Tax=Trichoplax adhaerens TaxID=10228 RepID=B3RKL5_TRIAD|nr:hypothetical protein TRIADDRAFT_52814 [Trichoplax adhaerens]EDV29185.1 hypothetical protein TRIADDRAFT_52814 [Trichoplax adhaerens]|eukprot:XP_002108387.1 hypothetical protein TRIADDRAFT_52814 [Trichoplax adhaerens]